MLDQRSDNILVKLLFCVSILCVSGCDLEEKRPEDPVARVIYDREQHFKSMGRAFKTIDDELKSREADFDKILPASKALLNSAGGMLDWFPEGSGPESGFETEALAEIWQQPDRFNSQFKRFITEAETLVKIAETKDSSLMTDQFFATGVSCNNCHRPFRLDDD